MFSRYPCGMTLSLLQSVLIPGDSRCRVGERDTR
ncbi:hypothetical protein FOFC_00168 [Fusarium oxysporum]|nr:hypothetical protein FOFC_00168 [Fusarium oxysporum]